MAGENVEFQSLPTVKLSNRAFENKFKFDPSNERHLRHIFSEDIMRGIVGSGEISSALEREWEQLQKDRATLRSVRSPFLLSVQVLVKKIDQSFLKLVLFF